MTEHTAHIDLSPGAAGSAAHRLDARLKVLLVLVLSVAVWQVDTLRGMGLSFLLTAAWVLMARDSAGAVVRTLGKLSYVVAALFLFYCWRHWPAGGTGYGGAAALALKDTVLLGGKLAVLLAAATWLYLSTAPMRVVDALTWLMRPLERFRAPVKETAFVIGLVIRYFPASLQRISDLHRNLKLRQSLSCGAGAEGSARRGKAALAIETLVLYMHLSISESQSLSMSLLSRGYNPFSTAAPTVESRPAAVDWIFFVLSFIAIVATAAFL